ncbi:AAA family ATPase [Microcoleus vaginatus]|uniref:AAA family ATPase n=1 Tax=Microcoleus vaginatus TaxID=119532 RepID=UPI001681CA16|nr:AAA family ATPase [Microcoleus sp. FACHB-84]MBD2007326.1 AAA family ATPase [Microcoleus sp. FACHB-45]
MLKEIEIQNFRCFEQIKISGFERVNLIGGKNNAGKTALLEALFLNVAPNSSSLAILRELRREPLKTIKAMPDRAWDNLFYAQKKDNFIVIIGKDDNNNIDRVEIKLEINSVEFSIIIEFMSNEDESTWSLKTVPARHLMDYASLIDYTIFTSDDVPIIPSFTRISGRELTEAYDYTRLNEKDSEVLKAFQVIDPAIESVESFYIGEPTLYLRRKGEKRLPLSLFGDAMNRVAEIILKLINSEDKILLIDEIENGIHYKSQREFWRVLFRLAVELDTQIFATTHSLEMLQAFADVGLELNKECSSAYFELARKLKTNQIIGIRRDLETLNYALEHQQGVRGE